MQTYTQDQITALKNKQMEIFNARSQRQGEALKSYVQATYPTLPKPKLSALQAIVATLEKQLELSPDNTNLANYLQLQKDKITNGDFAQPGTADMEYHDAYHEYVKSFVWPNAEELEVQAVEDLVLKSLQDSFNENHN